MFQGTEILQPQWWHLDKKFRWDLAPNPADNQVRAVPDVTRYVISQTLCIVQQYIALYRSFESLRSQGSLECTFLSSMAEKLEESKEFVHCVSPPMESLEKNKSYQKNQMILLHA